MSPIPDLRIFLSGYIDIPQEIYASVMEALPVHVALTRAEDGCLSFDIAEDESPSGRLWVSEIFTDQAAFDAHQTRTRQSIWFEITKEVPRHFKTNVGQPPKTS